MSVYSGDTWFYRLKGAQRTLIARCGGIEQAALIASYGKTTVGRWNVQTAPEMMTLPALILLEAYCGEPVVSTVVSEIVSDLINNSQSPEMPKFSGMELVAQFGAAFAVLFSEWARAAEDSFLTPAEADNLDPLISEAKQKLDALQRLMAEAKAKGGLRVVSKP
ncbi:hypothetical protein [Brucella rhizosphaerae]|uniref:hypothetical protein n=1 Tax=Brucella rhizosphaerae TaxID=571254 RepID=UPI00046356E3|nr:hypothetical protein [Brucella rhizosphaerae]